MISNHILSALNSTDAATVSAMLESVDLPRRRQLERRGRPFEYAYFIDSGVASVVAGAASMRSVEIGMIGREGVTGLGGVMGASRSPYDTFMQVGGAGRRITITALKGMMRDSEGLRHSLMQYAYAFMVQVGQSSLSNARNKLEDRLARWLLMVQDRSDGDIRLTHEYLAIMLGVRRAGVSVAMKALESLGLIEVRRGLIIILDRPGLIAHTNGAYGPSEALHPIDRSVQN